jgi:hypothetical protein
MILNIFLANGGSTNERTTEVMKNNQLSFSLSSRNSDTMNFIEIV